MKSNGVLQLTLNSEQDGTEQGVFREATATQLSSSSGSVQHTVEGGKTSEGG